MRTAAVRADLMLLAVAALWGAGFAAQKDAMDHMGPFAFNGARYAIGVVLLAVPVFARRKKGLTLGTLFGGVALGLVMFAAAGLQQTGIVTAEASRAAFLTGLYVIITPALGVVFRQRITRGHVLGGLLAIAGLAMLARGEAPGWSSLLSGLSAGDWLVLGCALMWALHVVLTGHFALRADPLALAWTQFVTVAALSLAVSLSRESPDPAALASDLVAGWKPLLYSGVFVIAIAFTLQIVAQRDAPPAHAAVLMSLEAVFGALFGVLLLSESLSGWELAGCGVMFAGMLASQLHRGRRTEADRAVPIEPV
jgi:drug/metabolite transporter (DMT)-like permease